MAPVGQGAEGPVRLVADAVSAVPLTAAQRTEVEALISAANTRHKSMGGSHATIATLLADQVEKGTIDKKAFEPIFSAEKASQDKNIAEDRAALTRLHALLTPDQRAKFVDALQASFHHGHRGHGGPGAKDGPRGEGPEGKEFHGPRGDGPGPRGDGPGPGGPEGKEFHGHMGGMGMMGLGKDLNLDEDQKTKIKEAVSASFAGKGSDMAAKGQEFMAARMQQKAALDAFKTESFDAAKLLPDHPAGMGPERMIDMAEKIVPILRPEQRKLAADKIREHAKKGPQAAPKPE
ncbi:MAG: hypothetical protein HOO96_14080 [Polyangiaceae bacterium]|nr:hypothetical protein [Polyangiaceae bacterium]